jgi:hypothetical protein
LKETRAPDGPGSSEIVEVALVAAAIAQGLVVGAWLALFPHGALRAGGFPAALPFFVRWAGVLHLVLAAGYALEFVRFRRVMLLVLAKGATAAFLLAMWAIEGLPWLMIGAIYVEGALAIAAAIAHPGADRSRRARARLRLVTPSPVEVRPAGRR